MKKNILRIFSLFAILIIACSMISRFVEDWMTPRVLEVSARDQGGTSVIDAHAIKEDTDGLAAYGITERQGVHPGLFAERNPVGSCEINGSQASTSLYAGQKYVLYSTKPVWDDQEIIPIKKQVECTDEYLLIFPEDTVVSQKQLEDCGFTDIEIVGNTARVCDPKARTPFMEDQLLAELADNGAVVQIAYSMNEVEQMKAAVPNLILVGIILLLLITFWGILCGVLRKPTRTKVITVLCLILFGFIGLYFALQSVQLPSSLLPERHIFDYSHYVNVFRLIGN